MKHSVIGYAIVRLVVLLKSSSVLLIHWWVILEEESCSGSVGSLISILGNCPKWKLHKSFLCNLLQYLDQSYPELKLFTYERASTELGIQSCIHFKFIHRWSNEFESMEDLLWTAWFPFYLKTRMLMAMLIHLHGLHYGTHNGIVCSVNVLNKIQIRIKTVLSVTDISALYIILSLNPCPFWYSLHVVVKSRITDPNHLEY